MRSEWNQVLLSDFLSFKNGKKPILSDSGYPLYGGNGIYGSSKEFNEEDAVIIGRVGAYCGSVHYEPGKFWISDNAIAVSIKDDSCLKYTYYLLKSLQLNKRHIGTSQPLITQKILNRIEVFLPSADMQKSIASTLSCLDAKIENNNKIIANLEQQVQAIFKSWFVDFEPFQDGEFVESELGLIPKGWETGVLGELIDVTSGKRPKSKSNDLVEEFCIPIIGASKIMGYTSEPLFGDKVLVIGRVGTHGIVQRIDSVCWPSDNTLVITSDFYEFVYQVLNSIDYTSLNRGSTQPLITQSDIKTHKIIIPPKDILVEFEDFISQLMNFQAKSKLQNGTLANLRDTLLPKLMSGEIEVPVDQSSS